MGDIAGEANNTNKYLIFDQPCQCHRGFADHNGKAEAAFMHNNVEIKLNVNIAVMIYEYRSEANTDKLTVEYRLCLPFMYAYTFFAVSGPTGSVPRSDILTAKLREIETTVDLNYCRNEHENRRMTCPWYTM